MCFRIANGGKKVTYKIATSFEKFKNLLHEKYKMSEQFGNFTIHTRQFSIYLNL